jgi:hypothetical protein
LKWPSKRTEEGKKYFQNKQREKERGRYGPSAILPLTFLKNTAGRLAVRSSGRTGSNRDISKPSGKPLKIPEKSNDRVALTVTAISSLN